MKLEVLDRAISATLTVAVILIAVVLIRREFWKDSTLGGPTLETEPKYIDDWGNRVDEELLFRMGQDDAPTQITVFFDLECPFCGRFHESVILPLLADRPNDVSVAFVQFPLTMHRFAEPAGKALECAANQGEMLAFMATVFRQQDSLGLKGWVSFAAEASVPDLDRFQGCVQAPGIPDRVTGGRALAEELGIGGTPAVVVNGWALGSPPSREQLKGIIGRVRRGESPIDSTNK
jgi:protein-disulfide isomerase